MRKSLEKQEIGSKSENKEWYNNTITITELERALNTTKSKSPGPDGIPIDLLRNMTASQKKDLLQFYNYIFKHDFSDQWREAIIVPILKMGKPSTEVKSYRPIALTNTLCKVLEKILNWRLQAFAEEVQYLDSCQSGYRAGRCTLDALVCLEDSVRHSLIQDNYCVAIFLDIDGAFDSVWHYGLLMKLQYMGVEGHLLSFIRKFLHSRKIRVKINGHFSEKYTLHSGVPQGSVISPTFFNILINDMFHGLPNGVHHSLFADDGAIWTEARNIAEAMTKMQRAIDAIETWSNRWGLEISTSKTKVLIFTHKRKLVHQPLMLHKTQLEIVKSHKFLGVIFDKELTWNKHRKNKREMSGRPKIAQHSIS